MRSTYVGICSVVKNTGQEQFDVKYTTFPNNMALGVYNTIMYPQLQQKFDHGVGLNCLFEKRKETFG